LSTAQSTLLRATREFFSHVMHFFFKESEGWFAPPLQKHNYGFCGGRVRVIVGYDDRAVRVLPQGLNMRGKTEKCYV